MPKNRYRTALTSLSLAVLATTTGALADDAAIQRCREVPDAVRRLACYDAITVPAKGAVPQPSPDQFGMDRQARKSEPEVLESQILGRFTGWRPQDRIELANGQIWQVSDDSHAALDLLNPKVAVRRGSFSAFFLEVEGTNRSPRVKRVR
jgi:hypothetical protein